MEIHVIYMVPFVIGLFFMRNLIVGGKPLHRSQHYEALLFDIFGPEFGERKFPILNDTDGIDDLDLQPEVDVKEPRTLNEKTSSIVVKMNPYNEDEEEERDHHGGHHEDGEHHESYGHHEPAYAYGNPYGFQQYSPPVQGYGSYGSYGSYGNGYGHPQYAAPVYGYSGGHHDYGGGHHESSLGHLFNHHG